MEISIDKIFEYLSWGNRDDIQKRGIELASNINSLSVLIMPIENKSIWENCAKVLISKSDEELERYFVELFEWLQDMNWPGAFCISNRLQEYSDKNSLCNAINVCIEKAKKCRDEVWESNLRLLCRNSKMNPNEWEEHAGKQCQ